MATASRCRVPWGENWSNAHRHCRHYTSSEAVWAGPCWYSSVPEGYCSYRVTTTVTTDPRRADEMATSEGISDEFNRMVNETVKRHVCSHEEVVEVCSQWFITETREMKDLPRMLEIYGGLRDIGHDHNVVLNNLKVILGVDFLNRLGTRFKQESPKHRLIRED